MVLIRDIAREAIASKYLSLEAEEQLRQLMQRKYDREDFNAFMQLQKAAVNHRIAQESRQLRTTAAD